MSKSKKKQSLKHVDAKENVSMKSIKKQILALAENCFKDDLSNLHDIRTVINIDPEKYPCNSKTLNILLERMGCKCSFDFNTYKIKAEIIRGQNQTLLQKMLNKFENELAQDRENTKKILTDECNKVMDKIESRDFTYIILDKDSKSYEIYVSATFMTPFADNFKCNFLREFFCERGINLINIFYDPKDPDDSVLIFRV